MNELASAYLKQERLWVEIAERVLGHGSDLIAVSRWIPDSRVYATQGEVAVIRSSSSATREQVDGLRHATLILEQLGLEHKYVETKDAWCTLVTTRHAGRTLQQLAPALSWRARLRVLLKVFAAVRTLHQAGVAHGDLRFDNIIVTDDGSAQLIDFDRSISGGPVTTGLHDWIGLSRRGVAYYPFWKLTAYLLVPKSETAVRRVTAKLRGLRRASTRPIITADPTLTRAWEIASTSGANAPGQRVAYYSMTVGGAILPGERPWNLRWEAIRKAVDFRERSVLELGCNMGLLSSFSLLNGASSAHGVDMDSAILEAARVTATAFGVRPTFEQVDLASDASWEEHLRGRDIVTAMSLLHWLPDPRRVLDFLALHGTLIYEGHDDLDTETARLRRVGFSDIRVLLETERGRHLLLARRDVPYAP